ncbi:hypothetical protein [Pseudorhodoferax sp.]|uniref:hypothetical protein n=1 Tax=Pseudorhodoferax sp. TaxID=1993553 RepID=UPI0039E4A0C7
MDWWRVITDLERAGVPHSVVAVEVGRSKGWVANLKNIYGTEPRFHDGMLLLGLWHDRVGGMVPIAREGA